MAFVPALYAWFNIAGFWDPYSQTSHIRVAVANEDEGATKDQIGTVNVGAMLETQLKQNDQLGWHFVSAQEARAEATEAFAASILSPMPSRVCEALPSLAEASDTDADTSKRFWSASFAILTPASDAFSESTFATEETNAELIWRSRAVAPAPVILGATALFFSLT